MAKGRLSIDMGADEPEIDQDGILDLKRARHPLIDRKKVVPVNIALGDGYETLVITGPNTGGKTVTLKTAYQQIREAECLCMIIFSQILAMNRVLNRVFLHFLLI